MMAAALAVAGFATPREPACQGSPVVSCSSAGCHGGGEIGKAGSEQSTWASADPHSKAFSILFNDVSQRMIRNLRTTRPHLKEAHEEPSCLVCHAANMEVCFEGQTVNATIDGVGCDGCHGPSDKWRISHVESSWKTRTDKASLGFRDNKNLVTRITNCAGCHVGDAKRTVDHDLIAAGHPRLAFEYARFHYQPGYRKHWTEKLPEREFELRAWFLGQVVSLKNALDRTKAFTSKGPWPELSDQSCFACHHSLGGPVREPFITPKWQPWYTANIRLLAKASNLFCPDVAVPEIGSLDELDLVMASPKRIESEVQRKADAVLGVVDAWLNEIRRTDGATRIVGSVPLRNFALAVALDASTASDWDVMASHYLALAAFHHADPDLFADVRGLLEDLKSLHKYPPNHTSPKNFDVVLTRQTFARLAAKLGESP